jgi:hypothetical protein
MVFYMHCKLQNYASIEELVLIGCTFQELGTQRHRQSGAPLLAPPKESGSGDGTGGPRPEGGAHQAVEKVAVEKVAGTENTKTTAGPISDKKS